MLEYAKRHWLDYITITLGCIIMAFATNMLYAPHQMLLGGVGGMAQILEFYTGFPPGTATIIGNLPLFYIAYKYINKDYCFNGLYGMIMYSLLWDATAHLRYLSPIDDIMLSCVYGGVLMGLGSAIIFRSNAHLGGMDIVGSLVNRRYGIGIGTVCFMFNIGLMFVAMWIFGFKPAMYTLIAMFISSTVLNRVIDGFDFKKNIIIVSDKYEELAHSIMVTTGRGATFINAHGAYTGKDKKMLFIVVKLSQVTIVRRIVTKLDPEAFMIISDVRDVVGRGFSSPPSKPDKNIK